MPLAPSDFVSKITRAGFSNYSPDFKIVAAIWSLNDLILEDLFLATP
jgi:hypothetical protein